MRIISPLSRVVRITSLTPVSCRSHHLFAVSCRSHHLFAVSCRSHHLTDRCPVSLAAFSCHGSWQENDTFYLVASPRRHPWETTRHYCFVYTVAADNLRFSRVMRTCSRAVRPGVEGELTFNVTARGERKHPLTSLNRGRGLAERWSGKHFCPKLTLLSFRRRYGDEYLIWHKPNTVVFVNEMELVSQSAVECGDVMISHYISA